MSTGLTKAALKEAVINPTAKVSILYIEDNLNDQFFVQEAVRKSRLNFCVQCVDNLSDGLAYLRGTGKFMDRRRFPMPSAVLSDFCIGSETSLGLLRWMRSQPECARTPVIIYSDSDAAGPIAQSYQAGANYFIRKAGSFERLSLIIELIHQCLASEPPRFGLLLGLPEYRPGHKTFALRNLAATAACRSRHPSALRRVPGASA